MISRDRMTGVLPSASAQPMVCFETTVASRSRVSFQSARIASTTRPRSTTSASFGTPAPERVGPVGGGATVASRASEPRGAPRMTSSAPMAASDVNRLGALRPLCQ